MHCPQGECHSGHCCILGSLSGERTEMPGWRPLRGSVTVQDRNNSGRDIVNRILKIKKKKKTFFNKASSFLTITKNFSTLFFIDLKRELKNKSRFFFPLYYYVITVVAQTPLVLDQKLQVGPVVYQGRTRSKCLRVHDETKLQYRHTTKRHLPVMKSWLGGGTYRNSAIKKKNRRRMTLLDQ